MIKEFTLLIIVTISFLITKLYSMDNKEIGIITLNQIKIKKVVKKRNTLYVKDKRYPTKEQEIPIKHRQERLSTKRKEQVYRTKPIYDKKKYNYYCRGKTHCSHMSSCAEAKFYINNCPNTKMDGDNDGIPCERQWCH